MRLLTACLLFPLMIASTLSAQSEKPLEPQKYDHGPDSNPIAGVPEGKVTKHSWTSHVFEGTVRDYYVYVPAQYDAAKATAVMVFQDGHAYVNKTGEYRAPVVLDNLIHKKEIPPIIGIFIDPGHKGEKLPESRWQANNRSFEYDTLSDQYSQKTRCNERSVVRHREESVPGRWLGNVLMSSEKFSAISEALPISVVATITRH